MSVPSRSLITTHASWRMTFAAAAAVAVLAALGNSSFA